MTKVKDKSKRLFAVLMSALVIASSVSASLFVSTDEVFASDSVSVNLESQNSINYGGTGKAYKYTATVDGNTTTAYCLEPDKYGPPDGNYAASHFSNSDNVAHTMYFCYGYPGQSTLQTWLRNNGYSAYASGDAFYALSHVLVSYAFKPSGAFVGWANDTPTVMIDSSYQNMIKSAYSYLQTLSAPLSSDAALSFPQNIKSNWTRESEFKSDLITLKANPKNFVTYEVPSDMTLHMNGNKYQGNSKVKIYGGNSFYLTTKNLQRANTTYTSPTLTGYLRGYNAYRIAGGTYRQVMGFFAANDVKSTNFSVKFGSLQANLKLVKIDKSTGKAIPQEGVTFDIYDDKGKLVVNDIKTDSKGVVTTDKLNAGTYYVTEVKAPSGYVLDASKQKVVITPSDCAKGTVSYEQANVMQKGIITIEKFGDFINNAGNKDEELLANVKFRITALEDIYAGDKVTKLYSKGDIVQDHLITDIHGKVSSKELPLGTYKVTEVGAFDRVTGKPIPDFKYKIIDGENEKTVTLSPKEQTIKVFYENVTQRNDGIPEIKTSARGFLTKDMEVEYSKEASIVDTVSYTKLEPGKEYTLKGILMDKKTGKPVTIDGKKVVSEKTFTPKTYDGKVDVTFKLDSTKLSAKTVVVFEDLYRGKTKVSSHKDIDDMNQTVTFPSLKTSAKSEMTDSNMGAFSEKTHITDKVKYTNLIPGKEYTIKGTLMNKKTGKPIEIDGKEVTAEKTFTAEKSEGFVELVFEFDSRALSGETIVVFENLYRNNILVGSHSDITDKDQSIYYPLISTTAMDSKTKDNQGHVAKEVTIVDTVKFKNLEPGKEYTLKGTLMDKAKNTPLLSDDKEITSELKFTAEKSEGTIDMTFTVDSTLLEGTTTVVFEKLYFDNIELAVHEDIEDEGQSIHWSKIKTSAKDSHTGSNKGELSRFDKIIDKVSYTNLIAGKKYTVKGILMDKETGKALLIDGKEVTSEKTFTAKEENGFVEIEFNLDSRKLDEKTVVVFEDLYHNDIKITSHADLDDKDQSITYPKKPIVPKTGDDNNLIKLSLVLLAALCGGIYLAKRKDDE